MDKRVEVQIKSAIGMPPGPRMERLAEIMQAEAKAPLADLPDDKVRRLARSCHGPFLAAEAAAEKAGIPRKESI